MSPLSCAVLAGLAVALASASGLPGRRLAALGPRRGSASRGGHVRALLGSHLVAAGLAGVGVVSVVDGWVGVLAGPVVALVTYRLVGRLEPAAVRARRLRIARDLPLAVDLLVVCLRAGRPVGVAASVVGAAVAGPLGDELGRVAARVRLGADPQLAWADAGRDAALGPLARAVVRALETGSPLAESLTHFTDDLRAERRARVDETARRVAVASAGPLGLCFLPAFVLVGIVPTVIGAFRTLLV